jgi:DNA-binding MarR family transcriptional regulator
MDQPKIVLALLGTAAKVTRRLDGSLSMIKGISFSEYQMLAALRDHPAAAATRVDLAAAVGLTPSGVTRALKPMEQLGFVETAKDARDARKSLATLTPAGIELVVDADGVVGDAIAELGGLDALTSSEREKFFQILSDLGSG